MTILEEDQLGHAGKEIIDGAWNWPAWKVKAAQTQLTKIRTTKWQRRHVPKIGATDRIMTFEHLNRFFETFTPEQFRWKVFFTAQLFLCRRVGEICRLKLSDLDFERNLVRFVFEKKKYERVEYVRMVWLLKRWLEKYAEYYREEIENRGGFLFFKKSAQNKQAFTSPAFVRNVFRETCAKAGIDQVYSERSNLSGGKFPKGRLFKYSTHSLRHTGAEILRQGGASIEHVQQILGHDDINTTAIYFRARKEETFLKMERSFEKFAEIREDF